MKAVIIRRFGTTDVLQYEDWIQPQIKPDQLLVKVHASSINPIDWKIRQGLFSLLLGNRLPLILGFDLAGEVVKVGSQVTRFQPGDVIYGCADFPGGAYAEYAAVPENFAAPKPTNLSYEEAASLPVAALTALQSLRDLGNIQAGQKVLVNGAAGGVGIFGVQIAKALGTEVVGVCSTKNLEFVKSLGADRVIDYTQQDFTAETTKYDIIFDAVAKRSLFNCQKILQSNGVYVTTLPTPEVLIVGFLTMFLPGQKAKFVIGQPNTKDLSYLKDLIEAGKIRTIIDRTYPLQEIGAAHAYSESERAVGKIAIAVANET
jgi:NADPH:quinone reductase-like Zn-dependent oxidoreductase